MGTWVMRLERYVPGSSAADSLYTASKTLSRTAADDDEGGKDRDEGDGGEGTSSSEESGRRSHGNSAPGRIGRNGA